MATYQLFYQPGNEASERVIALYKELAPQHPQGINYQQAIQVVDYRTVGTTVSKPDWLRGYPTLASKATGQKWEGIAAIKVLESWVQQSRAQAAQQAAQPPPGPPAKQPYASQHTLSAENSGGGDAQVMLMGDVSRSGSVVSDDLYMSRMPNKTGGTGRSTGKISTDDIAKYNMARS